MDKWVIGGYQADFDAAGQWAGHAVRGEGARRAGQARAEGRRPAGAQAEGRRRNGRRRRTSSPSIKKEDWNSYTVIAQGNHLVQKLNGITTVDLTDNDAGKRADKGLLALQLHAGPPMTVQFRNIRIKKLGDAQAR